MINPELKKGDKIILYFMKDEVSVPLGTKGIVVNITDDPFEKNNKIIRVNWENGSTLSLMSNEDQWKKVKEKVDEGQQKSQIPQDADPWANWMDENRDLRNTFDLEYFKNYFTKLRDTGIINMFGSSPLVYAGSEHIDRYYGEGKEDDTDFQEFLKLSDEARNKFIASLVKYARKNNLDLEEDSLNRLAKKLASRLLTYYITFL